MLLKRVKIIFVHQYALLSKKPLIGSLLFLFLLITVFVILQSYTTLDCNNTTGKCLKRNNRSTNSFILGSGSKSQNENGQDQGHGLRQSYDSHNINSNNDNLQMGTTTSTTGTKNRKENNNKESYPKDEEHLLLQLQQRVGVATTTTPENDNNNNSNNIDNNENDENVDAKDSLENYAKVKGRNLQIAPKLKIKINNENDNGNINDDSDGKASSQQQQREQREQQEQQQTIPIQLSVANVASSLDHLKANSESTPPVTSYQYISLPMSGDSKRGYTVSVSFPGSSKVFSLIVDSGSTDVAVAGENCCGSLVVPGLEWTEDNVVGETKMGYGFEGAWSGWKGFIIYSTLKFSNASTKIEKQLSPQLTPVINVDMPIAVITSENDFFFEPKSGRRSHMQGILGMAYLNVGSTYTVAGESQRLNSFFSYLSSSKQIQHQVFSTLFCAEGGELVLGGYRQDSIKSEVYYVPIVHQSLYFVRMLDVLTNGVSIGVSPETFMNVPGASAAIVDSGTTYLAMPTNAVSALQEQITSQLCAQCSENQNNGCTQICGHQASLFFSGHLDERVWIALDPCSWPSLTVVIESPSPLAKSDFESSTTQSTENQLLNIHDTLQSRFSPDSVKEKPLKFKNGSSISGTNESNGKLKNNNNHNNNNNNNNSTANHYKSVVALTVSPLAYLRCRTECDVATGEICRCSRHPDTGLIYYSFSIQDTGPKGATILGNGFQEPFVTVYDVENSRVGFALKSDCEITPRICSHVKSSSPFAFIDVGYGHYVFSEHGQDTGLNNPYILIQAAVITLVVVGLISGAALLLIKKFESRRLQRIEESNYKPLQTTDDP